jgi:hypothetical protein
MALLVPNIGEQESLRYLVNQTHNQPRNLILKLLSNGSATAWGGPAETDTPSSLITATFKEPYTYATGVTAATSPYGYAVCEAPYANQYGILLDGSNWTVSTTATCTASYPEQTFTFSAGSTYIHGYYVARANNLAQIFLNNLTGGASAAATTITPTAAASTATENILGVKALKLAAVPASQPTGSGGGYNSSTFNVSAATSIVVGQYVTGTGVGPYARVTGLVGTAVSVSVPCTGTVSGNLNFFEGRVAPGQVVSGTGVASGAKVVGYDPTTSIAILDLAHTGTVSGTITFSYSQVSATAHGALTGDVVYIARGSGNTTTTEGSYVITDVAANAFQTIPALDGTGNVVLYDSIMFLEKFTNGPYYIQNNGDQIKITLNVSLD